MKSGSRSICGPPTHRLNKSIYAGQLFIDGTYKYITRQFTDFTQIDPSSLIDKNWLSHIPPNRLTEAKQVINIINTKLLPVIYLQEWHGHILRSINIPTWNKHGKVLYIDCFAQFPPPAK